MVPARNMPDCISMPMPNSAGVIPTVPIRMNGRIVAWV